MYLLLITWATVNVFRIIIVLYQDYLFISLFKWNCKINFQLSFSISTFNFNFLQPENWPQGPHNDTRGQISFCRWNLGKRHFPCILHRELRFLNLHGAIGFPSVSKFIVDVSDKVQSHIWSTAPVFGCLGFKVQLKSVFNAQKKIYTCCRKWLRKLLLQQADRWIT